MATASPSERLNALAEPDKRDAALAFRDALRDARSEVLADAEGFMAVVSAIERLGKWLTPGGDSFSRYERGLQLLVAKTGVADVPGFARDLCVLRESRNDTAHGGAAARHAADEALRVSMVLEEALTVLHIGWEQVTAEHVMTRNPVVAESWQLVADVRRVMLTRGFTALPYRKSSKGPWWVITDDALAMWLNREGGKHRQGAKAVEMRVVARGRGVLARASIVPGGEKAATVAGRRSFCLVTRDGSASGDLLGVIAPADLL